MTVFSSDTKYVPPTVSPAGTKGRLWWKRSWYRLAEDIYFEWGPAEARKRIFMRRGFEYDMSSKPRFAAFLGMLTDENPLAGLFHDRGYRDKGKWTPGEFEFQVLVDSQWVQDSSRWSRKEFDDLYEFISVIEGESKIQAWIEKAAVRNYPPNWFKGF